MKLKQPLRRLLSLLLLTTSLLSAIPLSAETFTVGPLTYETFSGVVIVNKCDQKVSGELIIPESVEYDGKTYSVTKIGRHAFSDCSGLTSVTLPNSLLSIGDYAFYGCSGLTSMTIPNKVAFIEDCAFQGCRGLTSVTIPSKVTSIGHYAFQGCSGLTSVTIPSKVKSIGSFAFESCSGLTSVTIPSKVKSIGVCAFDNCINLMNIQVESDNLNYCSIDGVLFNYDKSKIVAFPGGRTGEYQIPNSVMTIEDHAFNTCYRLTLVTIPNSVTTIGNNAFFNCSGLTSVTIPNSVTSIGWGAFAYCRGLTSVTISSSVTSIGEDAFMGCSGLMNIQVESGNRNYCSVDGVLFDYDKSKIVAFPGGKIGEYQIPNTVTAISSNSFYACNGLTIVTIPSSVTSIGSSAFYACSSLTSVTIPSSVTTIGGWAFSRCSNLTNIYVESGNQNYCSIDGVLFNSDKSELVTFPAGRTGEYQIPSSVTNIGSSAFYACSSLTSITLPSSVTTIDYGAFDYCENLKSIYLFGGKSTDELPVEAVYTFYDNGYNHDNAVYLVGEITTMQTTAVFDVQKIGLVESFDFEYVDATGVTVKETVNQSGRVSLGNLPAGSTLTLKVTVHMANGEAYKYNSEIKTKDAEDQSAIEVVEVEEATGFDVYTLSGVCVRRNATDLSGLRPGIYIANGRKHIVR